MYIHMSMLTDMDCCTTTIACPVARGHASGAGFFSTGSARRCGQLSCYAETLQTGIRRGSASDAFPRVQGFCCPRSIRFGLGQSPQNLDLSMGNSRTTKHMTTVMGSNLRMWPVHCAHKYAATTQNTPQRLGVCRSPGGPQIALSRIFTSRNIPARTCFSQPLPWYPGGGTLASARNRLVTSHFL